MVKSLKKKGKHVNNSDNKKVDNSDMSNWTRNKDKMIKRVLSVSLNEDSYNVNCILVILNSTKE